MSKDKKPLEERRHECLALKGKDYARELKSLARRAGKTARVGPSQRVESLRAVRRARRRRKGERSSHHRTRQPEDFPVIALQPDEREKSQCTSRYLPHLPAGARS